MLTTPGGKPARSNSSPNASAETDEYSDGFQTTVFPAASAGASFHAAKHQRRIPRSDRGNHAQWLLAREVEDARLIDRDHAAFDFVGEATEVVEPLRNVVQLRAHLGDELPVVGGLDLGEPFGFRGDEVGELAKRDRRARSRSACANRRRRKRTRPRRRLDRFVVVCAARNERPGSRRKRVDGLKPVPGLRLDPFTADQHGVFLHFDRFVERPAQPNAPATIWKFSLSARRIPPARFGRNRRRGHAA